MLPDGGVDGITSLGESAGVLKNQTTERQVERDARNERGTTLGVQGRRGEQGREGQGGFTTTVTARCDKQWLESMSRSDSAATLDYVFVRVCVRATRVHKTHISS